jgi:hypothetical protein
MATDTETEEWVDGMTLAQRLYLDELIESHVPGDCRYGARLLAEAILADRRG